MQNEVKNIKKKKTKPRNKNQTRKSQVTRSSSPLKMGALHYSGNLPISAYVIHQLLFLGVNLSSYGKYVYGT